MTDNPTPDLNPGTSSGISRRTLAKGAAWTIPAVALAIGTPAMAASPAKVIHITWTTVPASATAGTTFPSFVGLVTINGQPAPAGTIVTYGNTTGGITLADGTTGTETTVTDASGHFTVSGVKAVTAGPATIYANTPGSDNGPVPANTNVTAVVPTLTATSGPGTTTAGCTTAAPAVATISNGLPVANSPVVFTISSGNGLFSNGSNTITVQTDASGHASSGPITTLGSSAGTVAITATATGTNPTSVSYSVPLAPNVASSGQASNGATTTSTFNLPAGAKALGDGYYLAGTTLYFNTGQVIATNVTGVSTQSMSTNPASQFRLTAVINGVASQITTVSVPTTSTSITATWPSVPSNAVGVGGEAYFLAGTTLYYGNAVVATGVTSAQGSVSSGNVDYVNFVQGGVAKQANGASIVGTFASVPANATALGGQYFLSGTSLYFQNTLVATGITGAQAGSGATVPATGVQVINVMHNGVATQYNNGVATGTFPAVPGGSIGVGAGYFLSGSGALYYHNTLVQQNIGSAAGFWNVGVPNANYSASSTAC